MSEIQFFTGRCPMRSYSSWGTRHHCHTEVGAYEFREIWGKIEILSTRNVFCLKFAAVDRKIATTFLTDDVAGQTHKYICDVMLLAPCSTTVSATVAAAVVLFACCSLVCYYYKHHGITFIHRNMVHTGNTIEPSKHVHCCHTADNVFEGIKRKCHRDEQRKNLFR